MYKNRLFERRETGTQRHSRKLKTHMRHNDVRHFFRVRTARKWNNLES